MRVILARSLLGQRVAGIGMCNAGEVVQAGAGRSYVHAAPVHVHVAVIHVAVVHGGVVHHAVIHSCRSWSRVSICRGKDIEGLIYGSVSSFEQVVCWLASTNAARAVTAPLT